MEVGVAFVQIMFTKPYYYETYSTFVHVYDERKFKKEISVKYLSSWAETVRERRALWP